MSKTQSGTLLIADISGYTLFLSESELEHAQEILSSLLNLLIDHTRPPLAISRTAGDAVISYALASAAGGMPLQGQTFVELLEDTYVSFRQAQEPHHSSSRPSVRPSATGRTGAWPQARKFTATTAAGRPASAYSSGRRSR